MLLLFIEIFLVNKLLNNIENDEKLFYHSSSLRISDMAASVVHIINIVM